MKRLDVLGSTGSIGRNTAQVVREMDGLGILLGAYLQRSPRHGLLFLQDCFVIGRVGVA